MTRRREKKQEIMGNEIQLVQFKLGEELFGVEVEQVREIVKLGEVTKVPKTPAFVEGVMNLRGQITTIIDLRSRFGISSEGGCTTESRIIVVDVGENQVGIIVDSVSDVIRVSSDIISPTPEVLSSKVDTRFLTGICRLEDGLMMLLNLGYLLTEEEMGLLENIEQIDGKEIIQDKVKVESEV
jgi:purine-binding chemotaxis protein CheW